MQKTLKKFSLDQLHTLARTQGQRLAEDQAALVQTLCELARRKAYLEHSHSLMGYVEEYLGIPRTTAYQYSRAAYLALEFPEVIDRIRTGKLSVYVVARVEKAFRDRANLAKEKAKPPAAKPLQKAMDLPSGFPSEEPEVAPPAPLGKKEKAEVLDELSGLTQAEAERKLTSVVIPMGGPTARPTPTARLVPETRRTTRLEVVLNDEELEILNQVRNLMAHKEQDLKRVVLRLADEWLEKHDPVRIEERRAVAREQKREKKQKEKPDEKRKKGADVSTSVSARKHPPHAEAIAKQNGAEEKVCPPQDNPQENQPKESNGVQGPEQLLTKSVPTKRKPIPADLRRKTFVRDQSCRFKLKSGRHCGSKYRLDIDHILPVSEGGTNDEQNLRVLCSSHNRNRHWIGVKGEV